VFINVPGSCGLSAHCTARDHKSQEPPQKPTETHTKSHRTL